MSIKIRTCERSIDVFYNGVYTYRARDILWKLYKTKRNVMRGRGSNINSDDGDGIYRLCATMRADVTLRGDSNNEFNNSDTVYRRRYSTVSVRRI